MQNAGSHCASVRILRYYTLKILANNCYRTKKMFRTSAVFYRFLLWFVEILSFVQNQGQQGGKVQDFKMSLFILTMMFR